MSADMTNSAGLARVTRRTFLRATNSGLAAAGLFAAAAAFLPTRAQTVRKPNILFIMDLPH